jgi:hypothetical protein
MRLRSKPWAVLAALGALAWAAFGPAACSSDEDTGAPPGTGGTATGSTSAGAGGTTSSSAAGGSGGAACVEDCNVLGEQTCSEDHTAVLECTDVGAPGPACLQWQTAETCGDSQACDNAACVPACCTLEGPGCCDEATGGDCCSEADSCLVESTRNGSELCDDQHFNGDPAAHRYVLQCLNANGGKGYVSSNSGGPCGSPSNLRCQCWEQQNEPPWLHIQYVAEIICDQPGKRVEVTLPSAGSYWVGVHPLEGNYPLAGYCPQGDGCMTCVGLLELPL